MSLLKLFEQGVGSIVIVDDLYLAPNPDLASGEALADFLRAMKNSPADCVNLAQVMGAPGVSDARQLVDLVSADLECAYNAYVSGSHSYFQPLFADLDDWQVAGLQRLRGLEAAIKQHFNIEPKKFGGLELARDALRNCAIAFIDFFLEGVSSHEQARMHHSSVSEQLAEKINLNGESFPKVIVLMSSTLPSTSELALFRKDTGIRGAFFHTIDKAYFSQTELISRFHGFSESYKSARELNGYLETMEVEIRQAANGLSSDLRSRLDVHDLTILKTLRLDGESDTPQAYLTLLLAEALAARIRMAAPLQAEVISKEHTYGDSPFDGKLLPSSVLFELFADIAVTPAPIVGQIRVAFGDVMETLDESQEKLFLVISPACDLQRCSIDYEVLCVPGVVVDSNDNLSGLFRSNYSFGKGSLVLKICGLGGEVCYRSISFDAKSLKTIRVSIIQDERKFRRMARLTEVFAQEIKTLALNNAARVGVPIDPSFSIGLKAKIRFNFTGDEKGAPNVQDEHDFDGSDFLPAVLAMGRQFGDPDLSPAVMFSLQFKNNLEKIINEKLSKQSSNKLSNVLRHFSMPESYKVSFEAGSWVKTFGQVSIKYFHKLKKLDAAKNFEIILYSELEEDLPTENDISNVAAVG